jgi:type I restriction enzyme M protein
MSEFKNIQELEKRLWDAADELRANTGLTSQEYSRPVLGLIFLRYAEFRFELAKQRMADKASGQAETGEEPKRRRSRGGEAKVKPKEMTFNDHSQFVVAWLELDRAKTA